ncbi:hypothetical protein [Nonomuraea sp. NPDC005501]|uniref:DUF4097 family beta strand repeat-containing protein n=1 Tax=Nonomuraea sp. NPDC005501 TaxID=3156884 RepID=UPI0033A1DAE4
MRALWLAAGTIATAAALFAATALLWNGFANAEPPSELSRGSFPDQGSQVRLFVGEGVSTVLVQSGEAGEVVVERLVRWTLEKPEVTEEWGAGTLRLGTDCTMTARRRGTSCSVDYIIQVPPEASLEADTASASLELARIHGGVRVTSVSGDVQVDSTPGDLYVRSGSGDVDAMSIGGERADVEIGTGRVRLVFQKPPADVRAVVRTTGSVAVEVPQEAAYDVSVEAPRVDVNVRRDSGAARRISASVAEGTIDVCCD